MEAQINLNSVYVPSQDVVAREVQGEFIIIPITSGVGDLEDEIYTLNTTGRAIWDKLDGKKRLRDIAKDLSLQFEGSIEDIEKDVVGILEELLKRRMVIEHSRD